ncbi:helix-turn-helix transcriptional regulator [Neptuniibacter sp. UBA847]|uniref:helix-turn-helix domain-containing protein n=1 Tax=Neptuniibacter sp. UBA847 TaxID=1946977 RepID=UPI000C405BB2|nr:helix-turn-helix transcriptional regulator [Neptuniibacter sp. UBA847]MAY42264.1 hypothetical protein [Oceanospirillaceae bacterium]|tara:strand:+ start:663 stop:998 length:336 start_codon:yes stop_codon:yes gene_type:complete
MPDSSPGQRLRTGRLKLNKKQVQVAHEIHKASSTYKSWEQNRARPKTFQDIINVCAATGISIDYYISGVECETKLTDNQQRAIDAVDGLPEEFQEIFIKMLEDMAEQLTKT